MEYNGVALTDTLLVFFRTVRGVITRPTNEPNLTKKQAGFVLQDRPRLRPKKRPAAIHKASPHSKKGPSHKPNCC
ncbi:hypothetical protein J6590_075473 [Homalodisca vitripennis]|nr:hypothetical protein J6590_075473 [Homalodisca vitripennis]